MFGSSGTSKEPRSSSSDSRVARVNFRLQDLSESRQRAQWKRLIHAETLDYIQLGPERDNSEDDQSDITKMIKGRFQTIVGNASELSHEQLRCVPLSCKFLTGRFNNGLYGHGANG